MPVVATFEKSNVPPISLTGTPSNKILLSSELPPRMNSEVTPPRCPLAASEKPGTSRSASVTFCRFWKSGRRSSVTDALTCDSGKGVPVALTTTDSRTEAGSSVMLRSTLLKGSP